MRDPRVDRRLAQTPPAAATAAWRAESSRPFSSSRTPYQNTCCPPRNARPASATAPAGTGLAARRILRAAVAVLVDHLDRQHGRRAIGFDRDRGILVGTPMVGPCRARPNTATGEHRRHRHQPADRSASTTSMARRAGVPCRACGSMFPARSRAAIPFVAAALRRLGAK